MPVSAWCRLACCLALAAPLELRSAPVLAQEPAAPGTAGEAAAPEAAPPASLPPPPTAAPELAPASPLSLIWTSTDPSCDGSAVGPRALELVSRNVVPRPTEARALVEREGARWRVQLETRSQSRMGQRTLRGESCKEIQQAISLLLAMIMEAEAKGESTPAPGPPAPPPEPLNMLNPDEDPVEDTPPAVLPPARDWALLLRSEGAVAVGLQPSLGLGLRGAVGISFSALELHVGGAYWPSSRAAIFQQEGAIEMTRQALGASLCYRWLSSGRIELLTCLGPEWLWMQWKTTGLQRNREGRIRHLATLNGSLDLRLAAIGPVFVALTPGFIWEQRRPFQAKRCEDCTPTDVFHTWDIGFHFGAGVGARF